MLVDNETRNDGTIRQRDGKHWCKCPRHNGSGSWVSKATYHRHQQANRAHDMVMARQQNHLSGGQGLYSTATSAFRNSGLRNQVAASHSKSVYNLSLYLLIDQTRNAQNRDREHDMEDVLFHLGNNRNPVRNADESGRPCSRQRYNN
jgi:uncharacterized C2H2 Zn-finger protein